MLWRSLARPVLFSLPAERVHELSMSVFHAAMKTPCSALTRRWTRASSPKLATRVFDIDFDNPIGLAAGFDKQAAWFNSLAQLGFSHIEVGTLTGQAQSGNPLPRLFRLPKDKALINRMGFNNVGAEAAAENLSKQKIKTVLGINIGKTKIVPVEQAVEDYLKSFRLLYPYARYFTVNVSSPNTPGLRQLQDREPLIELLDQLTRENRALANLKSTPPKPILLKIAPDLNEHQIDEIAGVCIDSGIAGVIATNTTVAREPLVTHPTAVAEIGNGGLSGQPLTRVSRNIVQQLYKRIGNRIPIVGVGGIMNGQDAWDMICSGASLIQVYTGFIYGGPMFVQQLNRYLLQQVDKLGLESIHDAVGKTID